MTFTDASKYLIVSVFAAGVLSAAPVLNLGSDYDLALYGSTNTLTNNIGSSLVIDSGFVAATTETGFGSAVFVDGGATTNIAPYSSDFTTLFTNESNGCTGANVCTTEINPTSLTAGDYKITSFANSITLNGSSTDVFFLFFASGENFTATNTVLLGPSVDPNKVFEFVNGGSQFLAGNYTFSGTVILNGGANIFRGVTIDGRVFSNANVTIGNSGTGTVNLDQGGLAPTPEPSTMAIVGFALAAIASRSKFKRKKQSYKSV